MRERGKKDKEIKGGEGGDKEEKRSGERKERGRDGSGSSAGVISGGPIGVEQRSFTLPASLSCFEGGD